MEITLTQDQLREVVLAALLDYENVKKTRRLRAVKKTLQGTVVATLIGSSGVIAANGVKNNQAKDAPAIVASVVNQAAKVSANLAEPEIIPAVAHFGFNRYTLSEPQKDRLEQLIKQLPKDSQVTVIGRTDSSGSQKQNKKIGMLRAKAVADLLSLRGLKVKTMESGVSQAMPENWMERRVDIVVESASGPFLINLTTQAQPQSVEKPNRQVQPTLPPQTKKEVEKSSNNLPLSDNKPAKVEASPKVETGAKEITNDQAEKQRQRVKGVVHFALNSYELVTAHKERLMALVSKLPKDSELIIVGRTESNGAENTIDNLGTLRAKAVANFMANNGVKVVAVGSKKAHDGFTGWGARSVDVIVESKNLVDKIKFEPPFKRN